MIILNIKEPPRAALAIIIKKPRGNRVFLNFKWGNRVLCCSIKMSDRCEQNHGFVDKAETD